MWLLIFRKYVEVLLKPTRPVFLVRAKLVFVGIRYKYLTSETSPYMSKSLLIYSLVAATGKR